MQYSEGSIGRVFTARLSDGEPVYEAIEEMARREQIESAFVLVIGGAKSATVVTGPKETSGPVEPLIGKLRDELLDREIFLIRSWRRRCLWRGGGGTTITVRPHSALGWGIAPRRRRRSRRLRGALHNAGFCRSVATKNAENKGLTMAAALG